jgi:hypothetical protein
MVFVDFSPKQRFCQMVTVFFSQGGAKDFSLQNTFGAFIIVV